MELNEKKIFAGGGLDLDSSPEHVAPQDFIGAVNFRVHGTEEGEDGYGTDIESTEEIEGERIEGVNTCIGAEKFETIRKAYRFNYNSLGYHQIIEFDYDLNIETVLFTNLTDSDGENVLPLVLDHDITDTNEIDSLPLSLDHCITDIKLIGEEYIVFTDGNMEVGSFNAKRLREGGYGTLTADDLKLIKAQVLVPPLAVYGDDPSKSVNLLNGSLFQFRTQLIWMDNEPSAWSTISKRPLPTSEGNPDVGTDVTFNNNIQVSTLIGTNRVKRVVVSARIGLSDWFVIKDVNRADIIALPNTAINVSSQIHEAYNPFTGLYSFTFYNDGLYNNVPATETDLLADAVPNKAQTIEPLNGNVLALGGITEGYDRPVVEASISVSSYQPNLESAPPDISNAMQVRVEYEGGSGGSGGVQQYKYKLYIDGIPKVGDSFTIKTINRSNNNLINSYPFTVLADEEVDGRYKLALRIASTIPNANYAASSTYSTVTFTHTYVQGRVEVSGINYANAVGGNNKSIAALKANSSYQLALAHYDRFGRPFPIYTDDSFIIKTQSYSQLQGMASTIDWMLLSSPPEGAVSAQWLISPNNTHQTWLYVAAKIQTVTEQYLTLNINSLQEFNKGNKASILSYDYAKGDRVTFHYYEDSGKQWITPSVDVEIVDFQIVVDATPDPDVTNYLLKVRTPTGLNVTAATNNNILIEIYTPRRRVVESTDGEVSLTPTEFYEIGEEIPIIFGNYGATGQIREGDSFLKTRQYENAITGTLETYVVEATNFSDFYTSNYTSYGRPRSYYDVSKREGKKASIRYSEPYRAGSEVNGMTRFYPERIYGEGDGEISSSFGWINKMRQRDNYLVCIQELKIWHIPIFTSILEDQAGQQNIAISDRILGQARGLQSGKFGMGGSKESYAESRNGTIYFIDSNNGLPLRDGYDGVKGIAGKNSKYFKRIIKKAKQDGKKILGWFDEHSEEYLVSIDGVTLAFNEKSSNKWTDRRSYTPDRAFSMFSNLFSVKNGILYFHNPNGETRNTFYGIYTPTSVKFVANKQPDETKTFEAISYKANTLLVTTANGITTSLGQVSELEDQDFIQDTLIDGLSEINIYEAEGNYQAGFLRDKNEDIIEGSVLKGNYATIELVTTESKKLKLFMVEVKSVKSFS